MRLSPLIICALALPCIHGMGIGSTSRSHPRVRRSDDSIEESADEGPPVKAVADTIYEALETFWNPLTGEKMVPDIEVRYEPTDKKHERTPQVRCKTNRCIGCLQIVTDALKGNLTNLEVLRDVWLLVDQLDLGSVDHRHLCYSERSPGEKFCYPPYEKDMGRGHILDTILKAQEYECEAGQTLKRPKRNQPKLGHFKYMLCMHPGNLVQGPHGDLEIDGKKLLRICGKCQGFRVMPDKYRPTFMNEVVCEELLESPLRIGKCFQAHHKVAVLVKKRAVKPPEQWPQFYEIEVGAGCEYAVPFHSVLANVVVGRRMKPS